VASAAQMYVVNNSDKDVYVSWETYYKSLFGDNIYTGRGMDVAKNTSKTYDYWAEWTHKVTKEVKVKKSAYEQNLIYCTRSEEKPYTYFGKTVIENDGDSLKCTFSFRN